MIHNKANNTSSSTRRAAVGNRSITMGLLQAKCHSGSPRNYSRARLQDFPRWKETQQAVAKTKRGGLEKGGGKKTHRFPY